MQLGYFLPLPVAATVWTPPKSRKPTTTIFTYTINPTYRNYPSSIWTLLTGFRQWGKELLPVWRVDKLMGLLG